MKGYCIEILEILLNSGIDIDDTHGSAAGETPLLLSVSYAHIHIVRYLVSRGARIDLVDKFGNSPQSVVQKKLKSKNLTMQSIFDPIREVLDGVFTKDVENARMYREEGNNLFRAGEYKRAIALYTDSIHHAEDAKTYSNRSQCYLELAKRGRGVDVMELEYLRKMYRHALSDANKCRAMNSEDPKGYFRAALAYIGCGDFPFAAQVLRTGVNKCPHKITTTISVAQPHSAIENASDASSLSGVSALHELLEELAVSHVPLGNRPLELRPKSAQLIHHSPRLGQSDVQERNETSQGASCAWCEMPLPASHHDSEIVDAGEGNQEPCPYCGCPLRDRRTPLMLRKKYLGASPREDRELATMESWES